MVTKEDIYYDSRDNRTKVHAISWVPKKGEIKGILQIVHGMAEHMERYEDFAEFMVQKGFVVVGNDHLGHGETVNLEKGPGYFCAKDGATILVRDVHRLKKMIQNAYPGRPYFILGHGMGSLVVRKYIMEYGKGIDGAIIMGTCAKSPSFLAREKIWLKILSKLRGENYRSEWMKKRVYSPYQERFQPMKTDHDWLSKEEAVIEAYEQDEKNQFLISLNAYKAMVEMMNYIQNPENFEKVRKDLPLLLVSGEQDPVGEDGAGVKGVYKMYLEQGYKNVKLKLYPNDRHEILNETDREQVYEDLGQWILEEMKECLIRS